MKKLKYTLLSVVVILLVSVAAIAPNSRYFEIAKNLDIFATLFKEVNAYYVDEVDPDKLIKTGIDAMLYSLDPYTNYIPEEEIESFRTMTTGQYAGIGAYIGKINGQNIVTMPYEGFPAHQAGLKIGDELIAVDGVNIEGFEISQISSLLKGQAKTKVMVTIQRYGEPEPLQIEIQRQKITVDNVPYFGIIGSNVGYIKLEDFTTNAGKEVESALNSLKKQGAESIILDVRDNPGGLLSEAVNVSNVFISKGKEVVSTKGKVDEWNKKYKTLNTPVDVKIPLVVMANAGSASASEIVSGVMQDYDRGVLVGSKTFGKGLVQTTRPLTYNSQLKVTTAKYYIPSGRCIQAIDYKNRNEDGSVDKFADSLKNEYTTRNGRKVFDGEGLSPDIEVPEPNLAPITTTLINKGLIFNFATHYNSIKSSISNPTTYNVSDEDYNMFRSWLKGKDYDYTTDVEKSLQELSSSAKEEKYYADIENQLLLLQKSITHSKEQDLITFKDEISQFLKQEIVSRYYLEKGRIQSTLDDDTQLLKAVEILQNQDLYREILNSN
ncbi:MAG: S41 family peptidase [Fulvivirga sp.]